MVYTYSEDDFVFQTSWTETKLSPFDIALQSKWQNALKNGYFRYSLNNVACKILPGEFKFLVQLNPDRAHNRRPPQSIGSLSQPFNPEKFNFTKIQDQEILFEIINKNSKSTSSDSIIINVSPLEFGHSMIIPQRLSCLPQVLTIGGLRRAIEIVLLSGSPALRAGFNSLCGYATVNHLHLHLYYLQHEMLLESIKVEKFSGSCHVLKDYPAKAFAFQLRADGDVLELTSSVYKLTNFLQNNDIAHNVYITRGSSFGCELSVLNTVRIYVWARKHSPAKISPRGIDPAICEFFGHIVVKVESTYSTLTESVMCEELRDICEETFSQVSNAARLLFEEEKKQ